MSLRTGLTNRLLATERRLAPHVDPRWTEQVLLELRLRDVPGDAIGAVLAEVDSHCAESGETAQEAFGDPVAYARTLELPTIAVGGRRDLLASLVPTGLQLLGMLAVVWAVGALAAGEPVELTVGSLALLVLLGVETALLVRFVDPVLETIVRRPALSWAVGMAAFAAPVALLVLLTTPVAALPGWVCATVGGVLLVVGTAWAVRAAGAAVTEADPVRSPLDPEPPSRAARVVAQLGIWFIPAATVLTGAFAWLVARSA